MARKIEFDRDRALHQSMMLFWEKGYDNTSMQDLVDTLRINRFSIYNTFGDKKALFSLAVKHYRSQLFEKLNAPLKDEDTPAKQRLDNYISKFGYHISSNKGELGCLIQSCVMSEVAQDGDVNELVSDAFQSLEANLIDTLKLAKAEGEFAESLDAQLAATHIMSAMQGLILLRKFGKKPSAIQDQIEFLRETVSAW